jgi:hypothetical protein
MSVSSKKYDDITLADLPLSMKTRLPAIPFESSNIQTTYGDILKAAKIALIENLDEPSFYKKKLELLFQ